MLILTTKLKNAINKKKPGMEFSLHQISVNGNKRGTSDGLGIQKIIQ